MSQDVTRIISILSDYKDETTMSLNETLEMVAQKTVDELRSNSPVKTGKYASGWSSEKKKGTRNTGGYIIYNKQGQLTHLLEKGHSTRSGGRTRAKEHIGPAERLAEEMLVDELTKRL